ncbi:MAG: hypothetical protein KIS67_22345 [Verrucomicrobiae bacterium]|nr:hypothetical protein [Verrucomicrobiae bacterium]
MSLFKEYDHIRSLQATLKTVEGINSIALFWLTPNMVDAVGTTKYAYTAGGQLWTEDGPFSSDTVTNSFTP